MGTFQYMAPEQVEGKEADSRSDIFALGAVLYEMATGKRAFEGKTAASAMAAVLEREPAPICSIQPMAPPALERLIKICLAKDSDERWQTAHDVKLQLQEIAQAGSQSAAPALAAPRKASGPWAWIIAAILSTAAVAALIFAYLESQEHPPTLRVVINPPEKTHFNLSGDNSGTPAISPDGRSIVFGAFGADGPRLYLRRQGTLLL